MVDEDQRIWSKIQHIIIKSKGLYFYYHYWIVDATNLFNKIYGAEATILEGPYLSTTQFGSLALGYVKKYNQIQYMFLITTLINYATRWSSGHGELTFHNERTH